MGAYSYHSGEYNGNDYNSEYSSCSYSGYPDLKQTRGTIVHSTDKAYLIMVRPGIKFWIPKVLVKNVSIIGDEITFSANKKTKIKLIYS